MSAAADPGRGARVYYRRCHEVLASPARAPLLALLDAAERARVERFRFARDRDLYLQSHALVRQVLAMHTGVAPGAFRYAIGPHGRPELARPVLSPPLRFNLSHTPGLAVCAVALGRDVGVDVERRTREVDMDLLAGRTLSPDELSGLRTLSPDARRHRFFEHWTLKEAYIKAVGAGMALGLRGITTLPGQGGQGVAGLRLQGIDDDATRYQLRLHEVGEEHQLAVAVAAEADAPIVFEAFE